MRIAQVVPGFGGRFYCENCIRDLELPRALEEEGHRVTVLPMYLPISVTRMAGDSGPIFFGAVKVFLEHRLPFLRRPPRWVEALLSSPLLLRTASRFSGSTRPAGLAEMTLAVLQGEEGPHAAELEKLAEWLAQRVQPDVVHLSNALLLGLARGIKRKAGAPVVCTLQDEDAWVDAMARADARAVWAAMKSRVPDVDAFVPVSRAYGQAMAPRLAIPPEKMRVVHGGIDPTGYEASPLPTDPPVIGYLSRLSEPQGLGVLVEAFLRLKEDRDLKGTPAGSVKLRATGGAAAEDGRFIRRLLRRLHAAGAAHQVEILPAFDRDSRIRFLSSLSLLSVPALKGQAFGLALLEAMAAGVPVVQPALGAFPEIVEETGGGFLYEPNDPARLAEKLRSLLLEPDAIRRAGARGRESVHRRFSVRETARRLLQVYRSCTA